MARMREVAAGLQELELGQPQRLRLCPSLADCVIELSHQLAGWLVRHAPQRRHCSERACREQGPTESLDAFSAEDFPTFGIAGRQGDQLHASQVEVIELSQK